MIGVLCIAVSVGSIIPSRLAGDKGPVYRDGLWISFSTTVTIYYAMDVTVNVLGVFGRNFVSGALDMCADSVICASRLQTATHCPNLKCRVRGTLL